MAVQTQRRQVLDGLAECGGDVRARGLEDGRLADPAPAIRCAGGVGGEELVAGTDDSALFAVDHGDPPQAEVPGALRFERQAEQQPAIRELRGRSGVVDLGDERAVECPVLVSGREDGGFFIPVAVDRTPTDLPASLHVEKVREVRFDAHLEVDDDPFAAVVRHVVVLVHARADGAVETEVDRVFPQLISAGPDDQRVGELEACRMVADRGPVEKDGGLAAELEAVAGDQPRIRGEVPLLFRARHLRRYFADEELVVEMDRHDRRTYRYLHVDSFSLVWQGGALPSARDHCGARRHRVPSVGASPRLPTARRSRRTRTGGKSGTDLRFVPGCRAERSTALKRPLGDDRIPRRGDATEDGLVQSTPSSRPTRPSAAEGRLDRDARCGNDSRDQLREPRVDVPGSRVREAGFDSSDLV